MFAWIEAAFPAARHTLLNRAIPAVTSGYVSACVPDLLPPDTDLVLLEFTYNDWVFDGGALVVNTPARCTIQPPKWLPPAEIKTITSKHPNFRPLLKGRRSLKDRQAVKFLQRPGSEDGGHAAFILGLIAGYL